MALKQLRRETMLVRFPGENHELSRAGTSRHRLERFPIILDWVARYLGPTVAASVGAATAGAARDRAIATTAGAKTKEA